MMRAKKLSFVNEVTFGQASGNLRREAGCQQEQPCEEVVGTFIPRISSSRAGREVEVEGIISDQWFNQMCWCNKVSSMKTQKEGTGRASGWWTHGDTGRVHSWWTRQLSSLLPHLAYASLPPGCSWVITIYSKLSIQRAIWLPEKVGVVRTNP